MIKKNAPMKEVISKKSVLDSLGKFESKAKSGHARVDVLGSESFVVRIGPARLVVSSETMDDSPLWGVVAKAIKC